MQIANTTANLSAKTVLAAENADTITGLKTFNRGAAAPFAVDAASLKVANLDVDKLDGLDSTAFLRVDKLADSTFNDGINHVLAVVSDRSGRLELITGGGSRTVIPFYSNAGLGVVFKWTYLDPDTGWVVNSNGTFSFQDASLLNTYTVTLNPNTGNLEVQRTAGTTQYRAVVVADPVL